MTKTSPELHDRHVTHVFRALADEHLRARQKERPVVDVAWKRIQQLQNTQHSGIRFARPVERRWPRRLLWAGTPSLLVAAGVGLTLHFKSPAPLDYQLVGGSSRGELITTGPEPAQLLFSDESSIEADRETTVSVHIVEDEKLVARLSQGKLKVHVVPRLNAQWRFLAGPYEIEVVGTRFELGWDAEPERLALVMHEGRVIVRGPGQDAKAVSAGEVLIVDGGHEEASTAEASNEAPKADTEETAPEATPPAGGAVVPPSLGWAQKVASGQFDAVVRDAKKLGIPQVLGSRSAGELQALAQAARYTGDTELAIQAWAALRKRFGKQKAGVQAAFFLGRIYDQMGRGAEALTWFDTYLSEAPSGVYASETLGRKLTLIRRVGGDEKGREVAREYLRRFPHGPYADTARDMLLND